MRILKIDIKEHKKEIIEKALQTEDEVELKRLIKKYSNATERIRRHNELVDELNVTPIESLFGEDLRAPLLKEIKN